MKKINIIGCGGHARSVADVILGRYPDIEIVFWDVNAGKDEMIFSGDVSGGYCVHLLDQFDEKYCKYPIFVAIGNNMERKEYVRKYDGDYLGVSVVSACSMISEHSKFGNGNFIGNMAYVGPDTCIGNYNIINTASIIEHESQIGDYSHVSVNSTICGRCKLGNNVFVGAGATVIDKVSICDNVVIGANSVVVDSIIYPGTYVGNPAKCIKKS